jgi:hypothetical protein
VTSASNTAPSAASSNETSTFAVMTPFVCNTAGNAAAKHPLERWGMSSLTLALAVLCAAIALSR